MFEEESEEYLYDRSVVRNELKNCKLLLEEKDKRIKMLERIVDGKEKEIDQAWRILGNMTKKEPTK